MAKRKAGRNADNVTLSRTTQRLIGAGVFAFGAMGLMAAYTAFHGDRDAHARATKEQTFVKSTCTVEDAASSTKSDAEGSEYTSMYVTFRLQVGAEVYPGLTYDYPSYVFNKISAAQSLRREFAKGAAIVCFYDPTNPKDAVLMRKAAPSAEAPNPAGAWLFGVMGASLMALGLYIALSKKRWKAYTDSDIG